ncbi:hypothetical protein Hanom_Chr15g01395131 [Helianthus anomalus]
MVAIVVMVVVMERMTPAALDVCPCRWLRCICFHGYHNQRRWEIKRERGVKGYW